MATKYPDNCVGKESWKGMLKTDQGFHPTPTELSKSAKSTFSTFRRPVMFITLRYSKAAANRILS